MGLIILLGLSSLLYFVYLDTQQRGMNTALWVGVCKCNPPQ
jgi:hypothetical protein